MQKAYKWHSWKLKDIDTVEAEPWMYCFDTKEKEGLFLLWVKDDRLSIKWEISRKINALLFVEEKGKLDKRAFKDVKSGSDCHTTAHYLSEISNKIWKIKVSDSTDRDWIFDEDDNPIHDWIKTTDLEGDIVSDKFPKLCKICIWNDIVYSVLILGKTNSWRPICFHQNGIWWEWSFTDFKHLVEIWWRWEQELSMFYTNL